MAMVAAFSASALATNGMQLIGIGPVQRSMGGAGSALPLDSFVITVNPAAMAELPPMIDLGVTHFDPSSEYEATDFFAGESDKSSSYPSSTIPSLGGVFPVSERLSLGLAAFGSAGMGVDYGTGLYGSKVYTSFEMMKVVPALSYRISDKFSVGAALNLDRAVMGYEAGGGLEHSHDVSFGYGFQLGAYLHPSPQWSLSLAYISQEWFEDFEFETAMGEDKLELGLPQQLIFGLGWRPTERLRLALDVKWINWTQTMGRNKPHMPKHEATPDFQLFDMNWDDQMVFAVGAEYDLVPEKWKLRAGYNYGKAPLNEEQAFENIAFPALVEHHFTAGVGWSPMESLWLNLGGMYAPEVTMSGSNTGQAISDYETSLSEYSIDLGLSYRF
jgi:long-chain fatty acid transport protein